VDRQMSKTKPTGHSVLLVGYDDNATITTVQKMTDGSERSFTYRGVFYFKNSWGTDSLGAGFTIDGQRVPGYGVITQQYAFEFGEFFSLRSR
jgi:C1A family cysteine protease